MSRRSCPQLGTWPDISTRRGADTDPMSIWVHCYEGQAEDSLMKGLLYRDAILPPALMQLSNHPILSNPSCAVPNSEIMPGQKPIDGPRLR